jgi:hypothetical protein
MVRPGGIEMVVHVELCPGAVSVRIGGLRSPTGRGPRAVSATSVTLASLGCGNLPRRVDGCELLLMRAGRLVRAEGSPLLGIRCTRRGYDTVRFSPEIPSPGTKLEGIHEPQTRLWQCVCPSCSGHITGGRWLLGCARNPNDESSPKPQQHGGS